MPRHLQPAARLAIAELAKEGITLDPVMDFHHLVRLDALAGELAGISSRWKKDTSWLPIVGSCGMTLHKLSAGARKFLVEQILPEIPAGDSMTRLAACAFVMSRGAAGPAALWRYAGNPEDFNADLNEWIKTLGATWTEIDAAVGDALAMDLDETLPQEMDFDFPKLRTLVARWLHQEFPADMAGENARIAARELWGFLDVCQIVPDEAADYGAICNALAAEIGDTPDFWMWRAPEQQLWKAVEDLNARRAAERRTAAPGDKAEAPDPGSRCVRATVAFREYKDLIAEEKKAADENLKSATQVSESPHA